MLLASGNQTSQTRLRDKAKKKKKSLLCWASFRTDQTSYWVGRGTSTRLKYIFRIPPEGFLNGFFLFVRQFLHLHIPLITFFLITKVMHIPCKTLEKQQQKKKSSVSTHYLQTATAHNSVYALCLHM